MQFLIFGILVVLSSLVSTFAHANCSLTGCYIDATLGKVCNMSPGETQTYNGTITYGPGYPVNLPALGLGEVISSGSRLGYFRISSPFTCVPTMGTRGIGLGNSLLAPGKICEVNYNQNSPGVGNASYAVTADTSATVGSLYHVGLLCNGGSPAPGPSPMPNATCTWDEPDFTIQICGSGLPVIPPLIPPTSGPVTPPVVPPVTPPSGGGLLPPSIVPGATLGPCGVGIICGHIIAHENGADVPNAIVQIKDQQTGHIAFEAFTDSAGNYAVAVPAVRPYYVIPGINRNESASPNNRSVMPGWNADFEERGLKADLQFSGLPNGTFILVSTMPYNNALAPSIRSGMKSIFYSKVVAPDGKATVSVRPGEIDYVSCWVPTPQAVFVKAPSVQQSTSPLAPRSSQVGVCGVLP